MVWTGLKLGAWQSSRAMHRSAAAAFLSILAALLLPGVHAWVGCGDDDDDAPALQVASSSDQTAPGHEEPAPTHRHHHDQDSCDLCRLIVATQHSAPPSIDPGPALIAPALVERPAIAPQRADALEPMGVRSSRGPPLG